METLTIKDLPLNEEIDSNDMAAIEGGRMKPLGSHPPLIGPPTIIEGTISVWNDFILPSED
jgi:hypothetical protein